ncbi:MAG: phosphatase PAP2 family protein [Candidatus Caenarcaniphilales bacterium]|nr:phosphatase PAP2 family protein [Candidatus Caenarcaniphilales bacterium]
MAKQALFIFLAICLFRILIYGIKGIVHQPRPRIFFEHNYYGFPDRATLSKVSNLHSAGGYSLNLNLNIAPKTASMLASTNLPSSSISLPIYEYQRDFDSFPSGHTGTIVAFALAIAYLFRKNKALILSVILLTISVSISRIAVGSHYLSDVLGGALISFFTVEFMKAYLPLSSKQELIPHASLLQL